jgi:hypothetical protein
MNVFNKADKKEEHIPLVTLWEHRMNQRLFSMDEMRHLAQCDDCLSLLGLCHRCGSIDQVERRLSEVA